MDRVDSPLVSIPNRDFGELQYYPSPPYLARVPFQSLIGILVNCNPMVKPLKQKESVSIPNRDFGELQFSCLIVCFLRINTFQSLIGILVNCNETYRS